VGAPLSSERYRSRRAPELELRARLRALAVERVRWGYRRLHVLLRREGVAVNVKRVYRLYREEGLAVRRRKRKRVAVARVPQPATQRINECWGMDFMSDVLVGGRRFRILNVVDVHSHEAVVGEVDSSLPASRVIRALEEAALERGYPQRITIDNGPEFRSAALDAWAYQHGVALEFIEPGKPMQNPFVESYNGKMRDELLNQHWWRTLDEARRAVANGTVKNSV
jgi:putative transposase